jgi:hypothetical protein
MSLVVHVSMDDSAGSVPYTLNKPLAAPPHPNHSELSKDLLRRPQPKLLGERLSKTRRLSSY